VMGVRCWLFERFKHLQRPKAAARRID